MVNEIKACEICVNELCSDSFCPWNMFISYKEFSDKTNKLIYPSEKLTTSVGLGITLIENELKKNCSGNVRERVACLVRENVDFSFVSCSQHSSIIKDCIVEGLARVGIKWHCTRTVRELKLKTSSNRYNKKLNILKHR